MLEWRRKRGIPTAPNTMTISKYVNSVVNDNELLEIILAVIKSVIKR